MDGEAEPQQPNDLLPEYHTLISLEMPLDGLNFFKRIKLYLELSRARWMIRRYFVINAFDGALSMLGVMLGALAAGVAPGTAASIGLAAAVAIGISGATGAYMSEKAERIRELKHLERAMLRELSRTEIGIALRTAPFFIAAVDGVAPLLMAAIILAPFMLASAGLFPAVWLFRSTIMLTLLELAILGAYLGRISRENILVYGLKTLAIGVVTVLIVIALGFVG